MKTDPYTYPDSDVLINYQNIRDADLLQKIEIKFAKARMMQGLPKGEFDYEHLKAIHKHLFQDVYLWAGQERTVRISKEGSQFAFPEYIQGELDKLFKQLKSDQYLQQLDIPVFVEKAAHYFNEINAAHPFREGNGRTNRLFFSQLAEQAGYTLSWHKTNHRDYIQASIEGFQGHNEAMIKVFSGITLSIEKQQSLEKQPAIDIEKSFEI